MANTLGSIFLLACTVVSAIMFAGLCNADGGQSTLSSNTLPAVVETPGETGVVDANNQQVTGGIVSFITPLFWPITSIGLRIFNFILVNFVGQKLPCTLWTLIPPRLACEKLQGPKSG